MYEWVLKIGHGKCILATLLPSPLCLLVFVTTPNRNGSTVCESLPQYLLYRDQFQFKSSISFVKGETSRCNIIISHLSNVFSSKLFFYICIKPYSRYSHFFSLSKAFPLDIQTFEVS